MFFFSLSCLSFMAGCSCEQTLHLRSLFNVSGPIFSFKYFSLDFLLISLSSIFVFLHSLWHPSLCHSFSTRLFLHGLIGSVGDAKLGSFFYSTSLGGACHSILKCKHPCHFEYADLHANSMSCSQTIQSTLRVITLMAFTQ